MEITVLFYHWLVSFLVILSGQFLCSCAKTVSLNELIAAESRASLSRGKPLYGAETRKSLSKGKALIAEESRASLAFLPPPDVDKVVGKKIKKDAINTGHLHNGKQINSTLIESLNDRTPSKKSSSNNKTLNKSKSKPETLKEFLTKTYRRKHAEKSKPKLSAKNSDKSAEAERFSLKEFLFRDTKQPRTFEITELITPRGKKLLSSLKYKKKFQIKSPLQPKKLSFLQRPRQKLKNQSVKRQVYNGRFDKPYVPLLKSLGMLFDNMLNPGSREVDENEDGIEDLVPGASRIEIQRVRHNNEDKYRDFIKNRQTKNVKLRESLRKYLRNKSEDDSQSNETTRNAGSRSSETNRTVAQNIQTHESKEKLDDVKETNQYKQENSNCSCSCATKTQQTPAPLTTEKAIATTTDISKISAEQIIQTEATSTAADITTPSNIINFRQDQNISTVPAGNPSGFRGNVFRLSEGSSAPLYGSTKGYISRDHGDSQYHTTSGQNNPNATDDEEFTDGYTRKCTNGSESGGPLFEDTEIKSPIYRGNSYKVQETQTNKETPDSSRISRDGGRILRNLAVDPVYRGDTFEVEETQIISEDLNGTRRDITERDHIIKITEDKEQSTSDLPELIGRFGGRSSVDSISIRTKPVRSQEDDEKSIESISRSISSDKRVLGRDGSSTTKVEETGSADETIITMEDLADPIKMLKAGSQRKAPYVTIIDGYSVARDINGRNKWEEQSIRYHS